MEQRIPRSKFFRAGLRAKIAIGAVRAAAFKSCTKIEGADIVTTVAVRAGFIGIGKFHIPSRIGLQQHLDQCIGTAPLAEMFLVVNQQTEKAEKERQADADQRQMPGGDQTELVRQRQEKRKDDLHQKKR